MKWLLRIIVLTAAVEIIVGWLVKFLRRDFQWLITSDDELPNFKQDALDRFLKERFDPELGWGPKPNTVNVESIGSPGALSGHSATVTYRINQFGARENPNHDHLPELISTYGDSYAMCRQVHDDETWQWQLSELTQTNVLNFGVGNYGIDQALLRLKREHSVHRTDIVVISAVPETIVRILSVWKHYCEYGNVFAFKPRFISESEGISLIPNLMNEKDKFNDLALHLPRIQKYDFFYHNKFRRYVLRFPYSLSILRHANRNIRLIFFVSLRKILNQFGKYYDRAWELILEDNKRYCIELYKDRAAVDLLLGIVHEFADFAQHRGFTPVLLVLPYESDLEYVRKHGSAYYEELCTRARKLVLTVDMTETLKNVKEPLYTNRFYGGHLNALGNELVAKHLFNAFCDAHILSKIG